MLGAKLKDMKRHGKQNFKHKPAIEREDLRRLKERDVIRLTIPQGFLYNFCFHVSLYFGRLGREAQRILTKSSFLFLWDENNKWYATMAYDESSKTRQGGIDDTATNYEKLGRMYQTDHQNDGFNALQLYCNDLTVTATLFSSPRSDSERGQNQCGSKIDDGRKQAWEHYERVQQSG